MHDDNALKHAKCRYVQKLLAVHVKNKENIMLHILVKLTE